MSIQSTLEENIRERILKAQRIMQAQGIGALFIPAQAAPDMMGMAKYFTNLQLWSGPAWVVLGSQDPNPALIIASPYAAAWNRCEALTPWVESPELDALGRAIEIVRSSAGQEKRIGVEHLSTTWKKGDWDRLTATLSDYDLVDITQALNELRAIKSPFEIEEIRAMGHLMAEAFSAFEAVAAPGVRVWDAAAAAEGFLKSRGCLWGRTKLSFDLSPQTIPTPLDQRFAEQDVFVFEIVYTSPLGYWSEVARLFSFQSLPVDLQTQIEAQEKVILKAAAHAKTGFRIGDLDAVNAKTWRDLGFTVVGAHTPHAHSIGLDNCDGPSSEATPDALLPTDMVLSFHPSTLLEGNRAFLISDNYQITPSGAVQLSPMKEICRRIGF
jgi:Xaa-Pro aminopeptidase